MADSNRDKDDKEYVIDLNLDKLIGGGLGKIVDFAKGMGRDGDEMRSRLQNIKEEVENRMGGEVSGNIAFRIRTGLGEDSIGTRPNSNRGTRPNVARPASAPARSTKTREPFTDILEDDRTITVIAEMPGVLPTQIKLDLNGKSLRLEARGGGERHYEKTLTLSSAVDEEGMTYSYRNGILEITLPRA